MESVRSHLIGGRYKVLGVLGVGATSTVYKVADLSNAGQVLALKQFRNVKYLETERELLSTLNHRNIVKLTNALDTALVLEIAEHGDLHTCLEKAGLFPAPIIRHIFRRIIESMEYLQDQRIAHRDLKLENFLIGEDFEIKLADFGLSLRCPVESQTNKKPTFSCVGTEPYLAPELLERRLNEPWAVDVFAAGVILFCLSFGTPPFVSARRTDRYYSKIIQRNYGAFFELYAAQSKNRVPGDESDDFKDLVMSMLSYDPKDRPTLQEIKEHPYFQMETASPSEFKAYVKNVLYPKQQPAGLAQQEGSFLDVKGDEDKENLDVNVPNSPAF